MEFQVRYLALFHLFSVMDSFECGSGWTSSHKYSVNAGALQGPITVPTLFLLYINELPDNIISNLAIYADDTRL